MPVVGVASKLRPPSAVGTKPVHTALPIPSAVRAATSQGFMAQQQELRASEGDPRLSCQLSIKSEFQQERKPDGKSRAKTEESRICKKCLLLPPDPNTAHTFLRRREILKVPAK